MEPPARRPLVRASWDGHLEGRSIPLRFLRRAGRRYFGGIGAISPRFRPPGYWYDVYEP